ncbi:MAG: cytochrome C oxidase Cbb3, partial [Flavobacteriales bacterium CG_4_8_14_3_um_filter_35_10]
GESSKAGEFVYDHPFLCGSKRTGPDLHREGQKYNDNWHFNHLLDPRSTSPGSIMPRYTWLISNDLDVSLTADKMEAMVKLGVPYTQFQVDKALYLLKNQASEIVNNLIQDPEFKKAYGESNIQDKEIVAVIAYLQRLGTDIKANKTALK